MIAFGSAITKPDVFRRCARPGIDRVAERDAVVLEHPSAGTLFEAYNAILDAAAALDGLEALVLLHQDTEIATPEFCTVVRETLADPQVGLVGCAGAIDVRSISWWEGSVTAASFTQRYEEMGGGELPAFSWDWEDAAPYARLGEVETLDGFLLVLPPWTVRTLRFDTGLGSPLHGYDLDFCLQVRAAGRKVVTAPFRAVHHHALYAMSDPDEWIAAHMAVAEKWEGREPGLPAWPGSWRERALDAEADAAAARAYGHEMLLELEAKERRIQAALEETTTSISWRLTAPLRRWGRSA
jgi:hypothetical protein